MRVRHDEGAAAVLCHSTKHTQSTKNLEPFLDLCVSSLRRGHANLLCIVPILTDVPERTMMLETRRYVCATVHQTRMAKVDTPAKAHDTRIVSYIPRQRTKQHKQQHGETRTKHKHKGNNTPTQHNTTTLNTQANTHIKDIWGINRPGASIQ